MTKNSVTQWTDLPSTRAEAKKTKSARYFNGEPCPKGHVAPRYTTNSGCQKCSQIKSLKRQHALRDADPLYSRMDSVRRRCRAKNVALDEVAFREIFEARPTHCPILGLEFTTGHENHRAPAAPEVDRIVPGLGYVRGNMWVICKRANQIKNDATPEELRIVADAVERRITEGE